MGVTLDLFSTKRIYRGTVVNGLYDLVHDERSWTVTASVSAARKVLNGEYIGFWCIDGRYRLFEVSDVKHEEQTATATITATDASIGDLQGSIVEKVAIEKAGIAKAVNDVMSGLGWQVNVLSDTEDTEDVKAYFKPAWDVLSSIADAYNVRITPHYLIENGMLMGKVLDVTDKTSEYRGKLVEEGHDASTVTVQYIGGNQPMIYGLGAATGSGDPPEKLTFKDVEWSVDKGDPVDKPKGQAWVAVPEAVEKLPDGEQRGQTVEWAGITDKKKLLQRAWEKAKKAAQPEMLATAQISDMEMIAGQTWKAMRMWDTVCVKPKNGEPAMLQITGIKRNYVRPKQTKITLGTDEETGMDDLIRQVAALTRTTNRTASTVGGHGVGIKQNLTHLEEIDIQVDEVKTEINRVWIDLDAANARIELTATREELTNVSKAVTEVAIELDAMGAELTLRVKKDEIASEINQTPQSVKIRASKIDLEGYVTAENLDAELASFKSSWADNMSVIRLAVTESASIRALEVGGKELKTHDAKYVKDVTFPALDKRVLGYMASDGSMQTMTVVTGYKDSGDVEKDSTYTYWTAQ